MSISFQTKHVYEKVGEPTEVALIVLVEKMNVTSLDLDTYSKAERANVCNNALRENYKKVRYDGNINIVTQRCECVIKCEI